MVVCEDDGARRREPRRGDGEGGALGEKREMNRGVLFFPDRLRVAVVAHLYSLVRVPVPNANSIKIKIKDEEERERK